VLVVVHDNPLHKYMYTSTSRRWSCSAKPDRGSGGWLLIEAAWAKVVAELEGVFAGALAGYWLRQQYQQQRRAKDQGVGC